MEVSVTMAQVSFFVMISDIEIASTRTAYSGIAADEPGSDHQSFQVALRVPFRKMTIFEGDRLTFIDVDYQQFFSGLLLDGLPFCARPENRNRPVRAGRTFAVDQAPSDWVLMQSIW
jgi:hypothetical protein